MSISERPDRTPDETPSGGLDPIAILPVFFKLTGKRVVVIGGSAAAAWKAELLSACGATTDVYADAPGEKLAAIAARNEAICLHERRWTPGDLRGAAMAIGEFESPEETAAFRAAAGQQAVPVNVIDEPASSDFQFGAIVERSPLVIGISTDGGAPVFGQALRARIETLLPLGFRNWARAAKDWRPRITALKLDFRTRRLVWEAFAARALRDPQKAPTDADFNEFLEAGAKNVAPGVGRVSLVGAGPGDPELLTLKAVRALQSADVVLFDDLVSPGVVDMARREATRLSVGKRGYKPSCTQEDITAMLIAFGRDGKYVVRLKGGDPAIFGRAAEEVDALKAAGIPVEIVPGVTSASAAAAYLGRSLTERDRARRLQFITAHARNGKLPEDLDWRALADPLATTVVYMGVGTLKPLSEKLIAEGLRPDTPAIVVERVTSFDERHILSTIAELPAAAIAAGIRAPAIIIIGAVLTANSEEPQLR